MTSKERVRITLARQAADRVPVNYRANLGIRNRRRGRQVLTAARRLV